MKIVVIGGGPAGFFAALHAAVGGKNEVILFEKSGNPLHKLGSGEGGNCTITNATFDIKQLCGNYPRGDKNLRSAFGRFMTNETINWFENRKVKLKTEPDGRVKPHSGDAQVIVDCLLKEADKNHVSIETEAEVRDIISSFHGGFDVILKNNSKFFCDRIILAYGASLNMEDFSLIKSLGHEVTDPVPSLFTFIIDGNPLKELAGISVIPAKIKIPEAKIESSGLVEITDYGVCGPAVLKLSSFGARRLADAEYRFTMHINWLNEKKDDAFRQELFNIKAANPGKQVGSLIPFKLPPELTNYLLKKSNMDENMKWGEISKEEINKLSHNVLQDTYHVTGKKTYPEEFVTCGGVSLTEVDFKNMQSRKIKGLYFAGEVLDIDGLAGGFNLQVAWTTGYIAGNAAGGN
ncbi:MAG: NAD(P)/FAD-dependent oxidoreductase [Bacteroidia bacterium]